MKIAVYGTLKQGYGNHRLLEGKTMLGIGVTDIRYNIISGGFPIIMASDDGLPVKVEVYDISDDAECLQNLDALEGEGVMYDRKDVPIIVDGERVLCSIYEGNPRFWSQRFAKGSHNDQFMNDQNVLEWHR